MALATTASMTLANARTLMSSLMQDEGTNPFWTSAQKTTALQDWYTRWHQHFFNRLDRLAGSATFGSLTVGLLTKDSVDATVKIWRHVYRQTASGDIITGPEVEQMAPHRVRQLQVSAPTQGPPTVIGLERKAANDVSGTVGLWTLYPWPIPDATYYFSASCERTAFYPVADSDYLDCSPAEARIVVTLAAIQGASLDGYDPEYIENLWRDVPREVQAVMRSEVQAAIVQSQYQAGGPAA